MRYAFIVILWVVIASAALVRASRENKETIKEAGQLVHPLHGGIIETNTLLGMVVVLLAGILAALLVPTF